MKVRLLPVRRLLGWSCALALILHTPLPAPALAQEAALFAVVNVDPNTGDDAVGDGSKEKPFKTITRALEVAPAGATVQLAVGEYTEQTGEKFPLQLANVQLVGDPETRGEGVKIVGGGKFVSPTFANQNATVLVGKEVVVRGVTITNPTDRGKGVWIETTSPVIVRNSFVGSDHDGIFISGNSAARISDNYFNKNTADGITAAALSTPTIENNVFEETGFAVNATGRARPLLVGNIIRNNVDGLIIEAKATAVMRNNLIENNRRSGVAVLGEASVDMGTETEAGGNKFGRNGLADVNNVTRPAVELKAMGNTWERPMLNGQVIAEDAVMAQASVNALAATAFRVLVTGKNATRVVALKDELALTPVNQSYQGKPAVQVGFYSKEKANDLARTLKGKGFQAVVVPRTPTKPPATPPAKPAVSATPARQAAPTPPTPQPTAPTGSKAVTVATTSRPAAPTPGASTPSGSTAAKPATTAPVPTSKPAVPPPPAEQPTVSTAAKPATTAPVPTSKPAVPPPPAEQPTVSTAAKPVSPIAAPTGRPTLYRVLVTVSSPEDLSRLKEVVDRVIPQENNGKSTVQVGVFSSQDNATRLVETLAGKGFQAVVVPDSVRS